MISTRNHSSHSTKCTEVLTVCGTKKQESTSVAPAQICGASCCNTPSTHPGPAKCTLGDARAPICSATCPWAPHRAGSASWGRVTKWVLITTSCGGSDILVNADPPQANDNLHSPFTMASSVLHSLCAQSSNILLHLQTSCEREAHGTGVELQIQVLQGGSSPPGPALLKWW